MNLATVPNLICLLRIALAAPIVYLLAGGQYGPTLVLFVVAALSDVLDGFLAKTFNWATDVGKLLDPLADKLLLVSVFVTLAWLGLVPVWLAAIAVARDLIIGVGAGVYWRLFGPLEGRPTTPSKLNTLVQLLFVIVVVWRAAHPQLAEWPATLLGSLVLVTTVVSGVDYVATYVRRAFAVSRARRAAA